MEKKILMLFFLFLIRSIFVELDRLSPCMLWSIRLLAAWIFYFACEAYSRFRDIHAQDTTRSILE